MISEQYKQQVYKNWINNGRPWFDIDKSKEPTYAERQIILEMKQREQKVKPTRTVPIQKNEVKEFHKLINNALDY